MHCLVTGGAGFIGSHVIGHLLSRGDTVRVLDNMSTGVWTNIDAALGNRRAEVDIVTGDVQDPDVCARAVDGVETVFHLAALGSVPRSMGNPWGSHDANTNGTVRLLEACRARGVRRFVYSSSSSVYGDTPTLPKVESAEPLCRSPYAASKLAAEQYTLAYARAGLLEGVALRYFNVFGPRQSPDGPYAAVIPLFLQAAADGRPAVIFGDGHQSRDFTYVENVVVANMLAADRPAACVSGQVVNVGAGGRTSLLELAALIGEVSGSTLAIEHRPPRAGDVRDSLAGLDRARDVLGYMPRISLVDGLRRTWEAFSGSHGVVSSAQPAHGTA